jgi:phospholipase C
MSLTTTTIVGLLSSGKFLAILFALLWITCSFSVRSVCAQHTPKYIIALMLENRAFDHMLGYLKRFNSQINGLDGTESVPIYPHLPNSPRVRVSFDAPPVTEQDAGHSFEMTQIELWGSMNKVDPASMNGFVYELLLSGVPLERAITPMKCYNTTTLPVLTTLAMEFALFDHWYASHPGPTYPNRLFAYSGTSAGETSSKDVERIIEGYPQRSIFEDIYESGKQFRVYFSDFPSVALLRRMRDYWEHIKYIDQFYEDVKNGDLKEFSLIDPRWFDFFDWLENDQHPGGNCGDTPFFDHCSDVRLGEMLLKHVYETLRTSKYWNDSLLFIYYDEHGGMYDHVPPPQHGVPNPDGEVSIDPPFNFDRLGLRVPAIAISPWINRGTVIHEPPKHHFEHSSLLGTVRKWLSLKQGPLTKREAWAATFENITSFRNSPRTDCPIELPLPPNSQTLWQKFVKSQHTRPTPENVAKMRAKYPADYPYHSAPMTDLQRDIVTLAYGIAPTDKKLEDIRTVYEGAMFVHEQMWKFLDPQFHHSHHQHHNKQQQSSKQQESNHM